MTALPKVSTLTDDELRANLIKLGYKECGPITGTTRSTYEKKLLQLSQAGGVVLGPPAAVSNTPSKLTASSSAPVANCTQTPTRPTNGASSTRTSTTPSKPISQQPHVPPNTAHLESLDETGSEDDQPFSSRATSRRNLDQHSRSNEQAFRVPAPLAPAQPLSGHLEQPSESDTDQEEFASLRPQPPPQASTVPKKCGPELVSSPRGMPPLEPSQMSTPIGGASSTYSSRMTGPVSLPASLHPPPTAGMGSTAGRFPRAVPRATATSAFTATAPPASGIVRRLLRFLGRQIRKHPFITLVVAIIAIVVGGILSAPATPGLGVEWCPFGYSGKDCQEKQFEVMQLNQRVIPLLRSAELDYACGRSESIQLSKNNLLEKISGIETELWEAFFQASKASNWIVWNQASTSLPVSRGAKTDDWSRVLSLELAPQHWRSSFRLQVTCAASLAAQAYDFSREVFDLYWQFFLIVGALIVFFYGVYKFNLSMKRKKAARLALQIKNAIEILKRQAQASNHNTQIPPFVPKTELRDQVLKNLKANKHFINDLNLALDEMVVNNSTQIVRKTRNVNGQLGVECLQWVGSLNGTDSAAPSSTINAAGQPVRANSPCLKIYHMFNPRDAAENPAVDQRVRSDVLSKCEDLTVLHLELDLENPKGQVFVKLSSPAEATKLMARINTLFYEGRPIEVREVDELHYAQRFPNAP